MILDHDARAEDSTPSFPIPNPIPVFPLPNVVFLPKTYLPLHIFEPRYRQMVADAAAKGQCVGVALLKEGWEEDYYGNPPVFEVGCVGRLVGIHELADGRYNILLQGLTRYQICEEFYERSYRQARVALKPRSSEVSLDPALRSELLRLLGLYLEKHGHRFSWRGFFEAMVNDEVLVNSLATYLELTSLEKQLLLEADALTQRARRFCDLFQLKMYERDGRRGWG